MNSDFVRARTSQPAGLKPAERARDDCCSASGLIWELKDLLLCNNVSRVVAYNPRSCNLVVHSLAALGASPSPDTASDDQDNILACFQDLVAKDWASIIA